MKNYIKMEMASLGANENLARNTVAAFSLPLNPTLEEVSDIKTAVSEAVTNSIVHGYKGQEVGVIQIECSLEGDEKGGILHIRIADNGCGIADVEEALQPFFSTAEKDERSGMGFTIMQTFMDGFFIESKVGEGTAITMSKKIGASVVEC